MSNAFLRASNTSGQPGFLARASMLNQVIAALTATQDVGGTFGAYQPIANPEAPTVALGGSGVLNGAYQYAIVWVTGGVIGDTLYPSGNLTAIGTASATISPANQEVDLSDIATGPTGTIARWIYRTQAGGSTFYRLEELPNNTGTTYTDNAADSTLTTLAPTVNTTGTPWTVPVYPGYPGFNGTTGAIAGQSVGDTTAPLWWDGVHWQQIPLWTTANQWQTAQTFGALATFNTGITGSGTTGALTAGTGILNTANTWDAAQTFAAGITGSGSVGTLTVPWGNLTSVPSLVNSLTAGSGISVSSTSGASTITNTGVLSFSGRTGSVVPASGDYTAAQVTHAAATNVNNQFSVAQTFGAPAIFNAGATLSSGQTFTNNGTITGGVVNPASGIVAGIWGASILRASLLMANSQPDEIADNQSIIGWNFKTGNGEFDLFNARGSGGGGFNFYSAASGASTWSLVAALNIDGSWYVNGVVLASGTPATAAGALSQENNGLFFGNGSTAQAIPVGGEYEVATLLLPAGNTGYNISAVGENSDGAFGTTVLINNLPEIATISLEAAIIAGSSEQATYVGLWDTTAGILVSGSSVTTTSTDIAVVRSGAMSLVAGHFYQVIAYYAEAGDDDGAIFSARIVAAF